MKTVYLCLILSFAFLGCKGGGGSSGSGTVDLSVSSEPPAATLFDVWTFKATIAQSSCPDVTAGEVVEEEYRVVSATGGCQLSDNAADGTSLTNRDQLFDDETTVCKAGGNVVTLQDQKTTSLASGGSAPSQPAGGFMTEAVKSAQKVGSGCTVYGSAAARLELGANDLLAGNVGYTLTVEGSCGTLKNCDVTGTVVGTRGRHAAGGGGVGEPGTSPVPAEQSDGGSEDSLPSESQDPPSN